MMTRLSILDRSGDITITWDHADEAAREKARAEVKRLASLGYAFFLVDGTPADAVATGAGTLIVRRLTAEEVVEPPADESETESEASAAAPPPPIDAPTGPKRRGRPRNADRQTIAVRPLAGG